MNCPFCKSDKIKVVDTKKFETCIIRARVCEVCNAAFKTVEQIELITPVNVIINRSTNIPK